MEKDILSVNSLLYYDMVKAETSFFTMNDYNRLMECDCLFARKFSSYDMHLVNKIYERIKK